MNFENLDIKTLNLENLKREVLASIEAGNTRKLREIIEEQIAYVDKVKTDLLRFLIFLDNGGEEIMTNKENIDEFLKMKMV